MAPSGNPSANASASRSHRFAARGECVDLVALDHFPAWREWKTAAMPHHCRIAAERLSRTLRTFGAGLQVCVGRPGDLGPVSPTTLRISPRAITKEMYTFSDHGGNSVTLRLEATAGVCRKGFLKYFRPLFRVPCGLKSLQIRGLECDAWVAARFPRLRSLTSVSTWGLCMARVFGGARMAGICSPGTPCMARLRCSMLAASIAA